MNFSQPSAIRTINRLRVLNLLRENDFLSRADIARMLGLNKPSTSEIIELLLEEGLVQEQGKVATANGRRPTALKLKGDARLVIGVELGTRTTVFTLADLQGTVLRYERIPTPVHPQAKQWGETIIRTCMKFTHISTIPIEGIAIATSGRISEDGQTILSHPYWDWKDVPLGKAVAVHTKLPTLLVNHVEAMVEAERWFGKETDDSFFYVNWAEHIDAVLVYRGVISANNTLFGHLPVAETGLCRCGAIGCLETVSAGWALSEKNQGLSVKQLSQQSDTTMLKQACQAMAMALNAASLITGCQKIILGGGISNLEDRYLDLVRSSFQEHANPACRNIPIVRSALKEQSSMLASVAKALDAWVFQKSLLSTMQTLA